MPHSKTMLLLFFFLLIAMPLRAQEGYEIPTADSPSVGPAEAPVTIVEFIDFT
jgi:hypothetical protein